MPDKTGLKGVYSWKEKQPARLKLTMREQAASSTAPRSND